jgi:outer membrane receptor protein involved in Fe transport
LKNILFFLGLFLLPYRIAAADGLQLTGHVRHTNTWQDIYKVNVYIKNSTIGTTTDRTGFFSFWIAQPDTDMVVVFQHVSFYPLEMSIDSVRRSKIFYLVPRMIQFPAITIVDEKEQPEIARDIPQPYTAINARQFDTRGYIDAGDLLRTEQSVQVDEELSGKKTIAVRAGNADDVTVLYNGIRMNNIYDNTFDLSMINLEDVERLEIIRGSNTALYGAEAMAGLVNIVPKTEKDYTVRFAQKFGTYAAADWTLQLNRTLFQRLNLSYSYKREGMQRTYGDESYGAGQTLENYKSFHSANIVYNLSQDRTHNTSSLSLMLLHSDLDYINHRYAESLNDVNQLISLRYIGANQLNIIGSYQKLEDGQEITTAYRENMPSSQAWGNHANGPGRLFQPATSLNLQIESPPPEPVMSSIDRNLVDRVLSLHLEKGVKISQLEWIGAYQFENGTLDFRNKRVIPDENPEGTEFMNFERQKHGLAAIVKLHVPTGSQFYRFTDFALTCRNDRVHDDYGDMPAGKDWQATTAKFSSFVTGKNNQLAVDAYLNFGTNVKFPTMFQQVSSPATLDEKRERPALASLYPEKNSTAEIGIKVTRELAATKKMDGFELDVNYFKNQYTNKLVTYYTPRIPVAFYENIPSAEISGLEVTTSLFFFANKLVIHAGSSIYAIPEKSAFPFKSDRKYTVDLLLEHAGFGLDLLWFFESEQAAWIRGGQGEFWDIRLPAYSNIDLHLSKSLQVRQFKLFLNLSGRNLLDDDTVLEGIAIRDRRFYLTFGAQY